MDNCFDNLPVLFWSGGLENRGDSFDPFDLSSGWATGVWSWLLDAYFGVNSVKAVGASGGLGTGFLQCVSFVGLILGVPVRIEDGGREGGVGCCAPLSSLSDIVEIVESTSMSGCWVCLCWSNFSCQDSNTSQ